MSEPTKILLDESELAAYGAYLSGELVDHELSDTDVASAVGALPKVPA